MLVERGIDADRTVEVLDRLVAERGIAPEFLRCDNGPEMTAHALQDWCRFSRTGTAYIEPGSPWQNPYVESFHSRVRDELLDGRGVLLPGRGQGGDRGLAPGLQPAPAPQRARDELPGRVRRRPAHRRRAGPVAELRSPLRSSSVRRWRQPYPAGTNHPPALTRDGPMNGLRSRVQHHRDIPPETRITREQPERAVRLRRRPPTRPLLQSGAGASCVKHETFSVRKSRAEPDQVPRRLGL